MVFGKIDYINLLPFHVFLKRASLPNAFKRSCEHQKSVPSSINRKFRKRVVDAAFISSIESKRKSITPLPIGIVAQKNVKSVILKEGIAKRDPASATSNMLTRVLGLEGEVFIGDRALKLYLQDPTAYIDLAQIWHDKYFCFCTIVCECASKFLQKTLCKICSTSD
jgi:chorismate dehydratase